MATNVPAECVKDHVAIRKGCTQLDLFLCSCRNVSIPKKKKAQYIVYINYAPAFRSASYLIGPRVNLGNTGVALSYPDLPRPYISLDI